MYIFIEQINIRELVEEIAIDNASKRQNFPIPLNWFKNIYI